MKVLMINGSPKSNGNTAIALHEMETVFKQEGIETADVSAADDVFPAGNACLTTWLMKPQQNFRSVTG